MITLPRRRSWACQAQERVTSQERLRGRLLHDEIQEAMYMRHKMPYCLPLSLTTLFRTV